MLAARQLFVLLALCLTTVSIAAAQQPSPDAGQAVAPSLTPELNALLAELAELTAEASSTQGETREVIEDQADEKRAEIFALIDKAEELGDAKAKVIGLSRAESKRLRRAIRTLERSALKHMAGLASADAEKAIEASRGYLRSQKGLDAALAQQLANIDRLEKLGISTAPDEKFLDRELEDRAQRLVAVIRGSEEAVAETAKRKPGNDDEKARLKSRLAELKDRRETAIASLKKTVELMETRELETSELKQLLIDSTGEITEDILDADVAIGLIGRYLGIGKAWIVGQGPTLLLRLVLFLIIIAVFKLVARLVRAIVRRLLRGKSSALLQSLVSGLVGRAVMLVGILIGLWQFGFSLGPILAGLGIAGLVIGLALQNTLSNVAAGAMILAYRPFDVGDLISVSGHKGVVKEMNLMSTTLVTVDSQRMIFPNAGIWGDVIVNVNAEPHRRVDMVFGIGYEDDIDEAHAILEAIISGDDRVLEDPEPEVRLDTLGDSSVDFIVRPWVDPADYWDVRWDTHRAVKKRFDEAGISIPFPQRDVHLHQVGGPTA